MFGLCGTTQGLDRRCGVDGDGLRRMEVILVQGKEFGWRMGSMGSGNYWVV